jgi:hypothetical protein
MGHNVIAIFPLPHVVDAGTEINERLELRMRSTVIHTLAVDVDIPVVADRARYRSLVRTNWAPDFNPLPTSTAGRAILKNRQTNR